MLTLAVVVLVLVAVRASPHEVVVRAPSARYRGHVQLSNGGRGFHSFSGIRYALPPVGHFRFQEPLSLHDTEEVLDAITEGPPCLQIDPINSSDEIIGDEDCLFLNVYTPSVFNGTYPVIFWIHGGSWKFGSGSASMYGPGALLDKDIVLVTVNYRVGPFGFSSLEDDSHPGNLGLKDQLAALRWTQRNIDAFGGDPDRITAAGQSAGAASVYFLLNAPAAQGLLIGGIAQSGSWLSPWAVGTPGSVREKTLKLADLSGCQGKTSSVAVMACISEVPGKKLIEAVTQFGLIEQELLPFRPVIEPKGGIVVEDPWLSVPTPLPILTGFTSAEGAFFAVTCLFSPVNGDRNRGHVEYVGRNRIFDSGKLLTIPTPGRCALKGHFHHFFANFSKTVGCKGKNLIVLNQGGGLLITILDRAFDRFAPDMLMYAETASSPSTVTDSVRKFYLYDSNITSTNLGPVIDMVSDAWIVFPVHEAAMRQTGDVYGYMFDHKGATDVVHVMGSTQDFGVSHGDDIPYLFNTEKLNLQVVGNRRDRETSKHLVDIWANFATSGRPMMKGLKWSPLREGGYMKISEDFSQGPVLSERLEFWASLPFRDKLKFKNNDFATDYSTIHFGIF